MARRMSLSFDEIGAISRAAALEHGRAVELSGVILAGPGTNRVEVLISVAGCRQEPCRFVLNVSRQDKVQLERELKQKLRDALARRR